MQVTLAWYEVVMASEIGRCRQLAAMKKSLEDKHGFSGDGWSEHIEGACGEMAVAKFLGTYWDGSINTFKNPDLPGIQVRTRSKDSYDLIVRPGDSDSDRFVLVTGRCPVYQIRGWILGLDAKKPEHLKEYGGRPQAYFVPASALAPAVSMRPQSASA